MLHNKNILINSVLGLGDTLHCIPFLRYLKQTFNCSITMMTRTCHKELSDLVKEIDQVWTDEELLNQEPHDIITKLKKENFQFFLLLFPLYSYPSHKLFAQFITPLTQQAQIPYRVGHKRIHNALTHSLDILWENCWPLPISFYPFLLLGKLGLPFNITYADIKKLSHLPLPKINLNIPIDSKKYTLILHSGGTCKFIQWPEHHYLSLCNLLKGLPVQIILTGTQEEINTYPNLEKLSYVLNLKGKLSSNEMTALVSKADGLLSGSTGPSHLAAAVGTTPITLYSTSKEYQSTMWQTLTTKNLLAFPSKKCTLCETFNCHAQIFCRCMEHIDPQNVYTLLYKDIKQRGYHASQ